MPPNNSKSADSLRASATSSSGENGKRLVAASGSRLDGSTFRSGTAGTANFDDGSKRVSNKSRKTVMGEKLRQVAMFANNIAMEDEEDLKSDPGKEDFDLVVEDEHANETGTQRLKRALTTQTKQKGLFRYAGQSSAVGIEPDVLMRVALEDEWQMVSCASLPFTVAFFVIFMLFFQLHYGVTDIYLAEAAIRNKLGTTATELREAYDIYKWLENDYLPFMWAARKDATLANQLKSISRYQELVGGVRLSTTVAKTYKCQDDFAKYTDCFNEFDDVTLSGNGIFARRLESDQDIDSEKLERQLLDKAGKLSRETEERANALPKWAKPGISERRHNFKMKRAQKPSLELRPRKRTSEAHDWCDPNSQCTQQKRLQYSQTSGISRRAADLEKGRRSKKYGYLQDESDRRLNINRPELRPKTPRTTQGNKSEIVIPTSWTLNEALVEVQRWKSNRVIGETTLTFGAEALVLNKNFGHELLSSVIIDFSVHRGGNVFTEVKIVTLVTSKVTSDLPQLGLGLLWVACLLAFSFMLVSRACVRWRQGKCRAHFCRFWNLLEWGIIMWGWMVVFLFLDERLRITSLSSDIEDYQEARKSVAASDLVATDVNAVTDFLQSSNRLTELSVWVQLFVALYHVILVCRFFLASRGQPRLAVVLSTIRKASVDLGHLFIVFMIIFIAYAISGHMLFGARLEEFSTFQSAFARCFQIVMEREFTWGEFTEEDLWTSSIWVVSFILLVIVVLVNIFLAMIFDTYGDVRSSVGRSATLWQTTKIVGTHLKHAFGLGDPTTRWVPNRELVQAVKAMDCQFVTPWMVKDAFPGISNRQVNYIFNLGKNRLETMLVKTNKSSLPSVIASILLGIERMHQSLRVMQGKSKEGSSAEESRENEMKHDETTKLTSEPHDTTFVPPDDPPPWLKVQLVPHFQKQKNLLAQVHVQIQRIERGMQQRGLGPGLGKAPGTTPRSIKARGALGIPGATLLPYGPSGATSGAGMLPAALRAGLTGGEDRPSLRQPGG